MKKNHELKQLHGEDLFYYLTRCIDDEDYRDVVSLIIYAIPERDKMFEFLEQMIKDDRRLYPIYPGNDERPEPGMDLVGPIPDGALYIK